MFVDMHHHLIYGIDDGARTFEGTQKMARQAAENQVHIIITTPHITPGHAPFPYEDYKAHLRETQEWLEKENMDITLYTGSEALYTPSTPYLLSEGKVPTLAGTRYVLVEFSPDDTYKDLLQAGEAISSLGYVPVYAHVERYECLKKPDQLRSLRRNFGALIQVNAATVIHKHGLFRQRYINRIFEDGLVDLVSSDSHDLPGRDNHMAEAFDMLTVKFGIELAHALTHENAEAILSEAVTENRW